MNKPEYLHIVCHEIPYPPDFGGVIDLYNKIRVLHEKGIRIILHCFYKVRKHSPELESICEKVYYYQRDMSALNLLSPLPFIVQSRKDPALLENLSLDRYPILLEGIHCTYFLPKLLEQERQVVLRLHNVEYLYYEHLHNTSGSIIERTYFKREAARLKRYENRLPRDLKVLAVARHDCQWYRDNLGMKNTSYLPLFLPYSQVSINEGIGNYCLYHGNLSVPENQKAVCWLLEEVFAGIDIPLVIAGRQPHAKLESRIRSLQHCCLVKDPGIKELEDLVSRAQVHVLPSFNRTGVKLKLIQSLFRGRHVIANSATVEGTRLDSVCQVANNSYEFREKVQEWFRLPFTDEMVRQRREVLLHEFDQKKAVDELIRSIW